MKRIRPSPFAQQEIAHHLEKYSSEDPGLGQRFLAEVTRVGDLIETHPMIGNPIRRTGRRIRRFALSGFPFFLIYRERDEIIEIIALAHTSRRPNYWRERLRIQ